MKRRKARRGTRGQTVANSLRTPSAEHLCALLERLERAVRGAEKVPVLLTPDEVAKCFKVSRRTVYRIASVGLLRTVQVGVAMRFHPDDLDDFCRRQRRLDAGPAEAAEATGAGGGQKAEAPSI